MASGPEVVRVYGADVMTVVGLVIGMRAKSNMTTKLGLWVVVDQNKWVEKEYSGVKFRMSRISYIVDMDLPDVEWRTEGNAFLKKKWGRGSK